MNSHNSCGLWGLTHPVWPRTPQGDQSNGKTIKQEIF
jgi:hypothetical protein